MRIERYKGIHEMAEQYTEEFISLLIKMGTNQKVISVALSGGNTPKPFFSLLGELRQDQFDWSKIHWFWVDERCVPPDHPDSNYGEAHRLFFSKQDIPATQIHRIKGENETNTECKRYQQIIQDVLGFEHGYPVFDLIMLGMGADGHTASIFPNRFDLLTDTSSCAHVKHPETGQDRITMTGSSINRAKNIHILVSEQGKQEVIKEVLAFDQRSTTRTIYSTISLPYPINGIHPIDGNKAWFISM